MKGLIVMVLLTATVWGVHKFARPYWVPAYQKVVGKNTVSDIKQEYGLSAQQRLKPFFEKAGVNYPPESITLLAIKDQKLLELWAHSQGQRFYIRTYPIKAASGNAGPKLREGDRQVPEGIYQLEYLNPNSSYHLSMKINYPNAFDLKHAKSEGRTEPGTNIFIHGKAVSIGCLAMGDRAIEELFDLTSTIGLKNVEVVIAPSDPRKVDILPLASDKPEWVSQLYRSLNRYFSDFNHS